MSLGIVIKGSEGIVLAADSRVTLTVAVSNPGEPPLNLPVNFDNATKLLTFAKPNKWIGAVTYGDALIGTKLSDMRTPKSFVPEFEVKFRDERLSVEEFSKQLSDFFLKQWNSRMPSTHEGSGMVFVVGGFDQEAAYGSVYLFNIPNQPTPTERSPKDFGITIGGQQELAARMIQGYDLRLIEILKKELNLNMNQVEKMKHALNQIQLQIPFPILSLQDCIDLGVFLIKTTTAAQNLSIGVRGVGGAVDLAVITQRDGLKIIQQKELVGERISE